MPSTLICIGLHASQFPNTFSSAENANVWRTMYIRFWPWQLNVNFVLFCPFYGLWHHLGPWKKGEKERSECPVILGLGPRRGGSSVKVNKERVVPLYRLFKGRITHLMQNFSFLWCCFLLFLQIKFFLFTTLILIWCFIIGSMLHFYVYIMLWHIVFSEDSCPFPSISRRTRLRYRFFSFLLLLTIRCLISCVI